MDAQLCAPGQLPVRGIFRILVCRPNHRLGNAVLVSALFVELETLYPGAEIDVVSGGVAGEALFADRFQVHQVFSLPRKIARHLWSTLRLLRELRRCHYDLAIDACNGSQSGRLLLAWVNARYKIGFAGTMESAAQAGLACPEHLAQRSVFLLRTAYAGQSDGPWPRLDIELPEVEKLQAKRALAAILGEAPGHARSRRVIGVFSNATGAKLYDVSWWSQFISTFQALQPDVQLVDLVAEQGQTQLRGDFPAYYTRNLRHFAAMISAMDGFISADCGVMHLAVASGTPTLGLFSVTSVAKYGPYGPGNAAVDTSALRASDVAAVASNWAVANARANVASNPR